MSFHLGSPNNTYNRRGGGGGGGNRRGSGGGNNSMGGGNMGGGGGGHRSPLDKPISPEEEAKNKLTSLMVRIGDKVTTTATLESNIEGLVGVLLPDLENNRSTIVTILLKCISQLPYKTPIYATIIGKMNQKNPDFGKEICETIIHDINENLKKQKFKQAKLLIRCIGCLVNTHVVSTSTMFEVFDILLSPLSQEYTQTRADFYVHLVLTTLPWVGSSLSNEVEQLSKLFEDLETYLGGRSHAEKKFFQTFAENDDLLESLSKQVKLQKEDSWNCESIIQIHKSFDFVDSQQHPLASIVLPLNDEKFNYPTFTRPLFRIFDDSQDAIKPIDRYIIEEYIVDILYYFNGAHKEAAKFIYSLPVTTEIDAIVVETLLSEAFKLPGSDFKLIYYSVMLVDLFKEQHQTIIPVFAYAITTLFENIDHLDTEVVERFATMFAHHLSNFEYKWVWGDWATCLTSQPSGDPTTDNLLHLQKKFIIHLLESITRLSYLDKMKQSLPVEYHPYLPQLPQPNFKFLKSNGKNI
ncbi:initiation factor eIF-4 gamma middle domain-containing protein [Cavenderia fasciculata]|uniref:Initiation factor eIF-4 gamma middle domain-containing protein n=1 Tax=Cavenderia fasciculata TaxID=261658 RepID=F4Q722_CACFS|nr:initiation factor eIF-4 gamma middle domain-containing protein [Cavenderia fasciculata]EGG16204.1 initiation factor eIF-4 gamma middle domain-containing protein [Cavenderia fasciculata]|eukprot:XP_004354588.1 initiation factor eIF-4 gamma middle domain-containing protein [Cavenderia fasciculata]